jgi:phage replication-related protein YjqB (UPF0714/DUF867 family)
MADKFPDLDSLKKAHKKSEYRITCCHRDAPITVICVHGGYIEPGTSAIARAVAARKYNLFDFQCLSPEVGKDMHITSTRFREPGLEEMINSSQATISIHGMGNQGTATIWLGGMNQRLKEVTLNLLRQQGFDVDPNGPRYRGESPQNVVNLAREHGVQLEISQELMDQLFQGPAFRRDRRKLAVTERFTTLTSTLRLALRLYLLHSAPSQ